MKHLSIFFITLIVSCKVFSQESTTIYYNSNWEIVPKQGSQYYRTCKVNTGHKNHFFVGSVEDYTTDGRLVMKGEYLETGLKNGEFTFFFPSGKIQSQGKFRSGIRVGVWKYYFENGKMEREVKFPFPENYKFIPNNFKPIAVYDSTGLPLIQNGTGTWNYQYEWYGVSDRYIITGKFEKGDMEGLWTCATSNGQILYRELYKNGKFQGGVLINDNKEEALLEPIDNKFMMPYKIEVTENFICSRETSPQDYPLLSFLSFNLQENSANGESTFVIVEKTAQYPGGFSAMTKFIKDNLIYSKTAANLGVKGKVRVKFIVNEDGSLSNILIEKGLHADLDKEAIRIVSLFPNWIPAEQNGKAVKSQFSIPIPFPAK